LHGKGQSLRPAMPPASSRRVFLLAVPLPRLRRFAAMLIKGPWRITGGPCWLGHINMPSMDCRASTRTLEALWSVQRQRARRADRAPFCGLQERASLGRSRWPSGTRSGSRVLLYGQALVKRLIMAKNALKIDCGSWLPFVGLPFSPQAQNLERAFPLSGFLERV
jgi:hypothetical protein